MPTHKMHMAIANRVNETLKLDNDMVMIGSVLPDLTKDKRHRQSHFKNGKEGVEGTANPYKFLIKYKKDLENPVMVGYLIHLLTDRYFNSYVFQNYYIYDENTHLIGIKFHNEEAKLPIEKIRYEKHRDFYVYDKYLIENGQVDKFKSTDCIKNISNTEDAKFDKNLIKTYIQNANKDIENGKTGNYLKELKIDFNVMTLEDLNIQLDKCVNQILKFINNLNSSKTRETIIKELKNLKDEKYQKFNQRLLPNTSKIIGVKASILKQYEKNLLKNEKLENIYKSLKNEYHEELLLKALLISSEKDIEKSLDYTKKFIPEINNWAICDSLVSNLKITKKCKKEMRKLILTYKDSTKEYELRFMLVMILTYFTEKEYLKENFQIFNSITSKNYYVETSLARAILISLIKYYDETLKYLKTAKVNTSVYKTVLKKAQNSSKLSKEQKEILKKQKKDLKIPF